MERRLQVVVNVWLLMPHLVGTALKVKALLAPTPVVGPTAIPRRHAAAAAGAAALSARRPARAQGRRLRCGGADAR